MTYAQINELLNYGTDAQCCAAIVALMYVGLTY